METQIKVYKPLVAIKLKDGRIVTVDLSMEKVAEILNSKDFVMFGDIGFGKFEVRTFEKFNPTEIDMFILSQEKSVAEELQNIYNERTQKGFSTKSSEHLWEIYQSRKKE